jgi:hypothetical protein
VNTWIRWTRLIVLFIGVMATPGLAMTQQRLFEVGGQLVVARQADAWSA